MNDTAYPANTHPNPFTQELLKHGVPEQLHDSLRQYGVGELVGKLEIFFQEVTAERVVATMPVEGNRQVSGVVHGGAHVAFAETLGSFAANVHAGPGRMAVGVDVNATHVRGVSSGFLTGTCVAVHLGNTVTNHTITITDERGRVASTARITNLIRPQA